MYSRFQDEDVSEGEIENEAGAMEISFEVLNKALQVWFMDFFALNAKIRNEAFL